MIRSWPTRAGIWQAPGARLFLREDVARRAAPPPHAGSPLPLPPAAAAQLRAFVQRQAAIVQGAQEPGQVRAALAARELPIVGARAGLAELEDGRLLSDVRALLARPRQDQGAAQARALVERLVGVLD